MAAPRRAAAQIKSRLLAHATEESLHGTLQPRTPGRHPLPPRLPLGNDRTPAGLAARQAFLEKRGFSLDHLAGRLPADTPAALAGNIENLVGFAQLPVGVIGPLRVNGLQARGDYYVPMATTEGALVASYNRGAYVLSQSGGVTALCLTESVSRAPCFVFGGLADAARFVSWVLDRFDDLQPVVASTSRHCRLADMRTSLIGKEVYLVFDYTTGDAAGQNMVTLATEALCRHLSETSPVRPLRWYVEGNLSGDKKATMLSFLFARGKKVVTEATVRADLLHRTMRATPQAMKAAWEVSMLGALQSGAIGSQAHFANALAAIFIACGQDAACVSEAAVGMTRMDVTAAGDLYTSVTLPNLIVGTVGGGTGLATAHECLALLGCAGEGGAAAFAEICAAAAMAGEISLMAAIVAGEFTQAHARYGRRARPTT